MKTEMKKEWVLGGGIILFIVLCLCLYLGKNHSYKQNVDPDHRIVMEDPQASVEVSGKAERFDAPVTMSKQEYGWRVFGFVTSNATSKAIPKAMLELRVNPTTGLGCEDLVTVTDSEGNYQFLMDGNISTDQEITLTVQAEGYASAQAILFLPSLKNGKSKELQHHFQLENGATVSGVVCDEGGDPIAGATVGVYQPAPFACYWRDDNEFAYPVATTDQSGEFNLEGVSSDSVQYLLAFADGYLTESVLITSPKRMEMVLRASDGTSIMGKVTFADGTPAPGFPVEVNHTHHRSKRSRVRNPITEPDTKIKKILTGEEGFFEFSDIASGYYQMKAGLQVSGVCTASNVFMLEPKSEKVVNLVLPDVKTLKASVCDWLTHEPLAGIRVQNHDPNVQIPENILRRFSLVDFQRTVTDMNGQFTLSVNQSHSQDYNRMTSTGFFCLLPEDYRLNGKAWERFTLQFFLSRDDLRIFIKRPNLFKGKVLKQDGKTIVSGATVYFGYTHAHADRTKKDAETYITNQSGEFEFTSKEDKKYISVIVDGAETGVRAEADGATQRWEGDLILEDAPGVTSGYVYDHQGNIVSGVPVTLKYNLPDRAQRMRGMCGFSHQIPDVYSEILSNQEGYYQFKNLKVGKYTVVGGDNSHIPEVKEHLVTISSGKEVADIDFHLLPRTSFSGTVTDEKGDPVSNVTVFVDTSHTAGKEQVRSRQECITNKEGEFDFVDCIPLYHEHFTIQCLHPSYLKIYQGYSIKEAPVSIQLTKRPKLTFFVYNNNHHYLNNFKYELRPSSQGIAMNSKIFAQTVIDQARPISHFLSCEEYELKVEKLDESGQETGIKGIELFDLSDGSDLEGSINLGDPLSIIGIVQLDDKTPISDVYVELKQTGSSYGPSKRAESDSEGHFSFGDLNGGKYSLKAEKEGMVQKEPINLSLKSSNSPLDIEVLLVEGGIISGHVYGFEGGPLEGAQILIGRDSKGFTDRNGFFEIKSLSQGEKQINLYLKDENGKLRYVETKIRTLPLNGNEVVDFDFSGCVWAGVRFKLHGDNSRSIRYSLYSQSSEPVISRTVYKSSLNQKLVLKPGAYQLHLGEFDSGQSVTILPKDHYQVYEIILNLAQVDVFIADDLVPRHQGTLTYIHESLSGVQREAQFNMKESRYAIKNQPHGRCRGEFITNDGREFVSDGWVEISEASEKILTLIPKDLVEK